MGSDFIGERGSGDTDVEPYDNRRGTSNTTKGLIAFLIVVAVIFWKLVGLEVIGALLSDMGMTRADRDRAKAVELVKVEAEQIRAKLPLRIDPTTVLVRVEQKDLRLDYYYDLAVDVKPRDIPKARHILYQSIRQDTCVKAKPFLDGGGQMFHHVTDASGDEIEIETVCFDFYSG